MAACGAGAGPGNADRAHPFLFTTAADIQRARDGARENPVFARLAAELLDRATTNRLEDLPSLDEAWWQEAKHKSWGNTYPEVFHHTWMVPLKWADLARTCARASLLGNAPGLADKGRRILLRLSDYTFEFEHYDVGMNYTVWTVAALDAYDILYSGFTVHDHARLDAFFDRYVAAVRKNDDYWIEREPGGRLNNHYAWHKLGLAMIGVFKDRPGLVERALHGPKGVEHMLAEGFRDDGLWLEGSIPYQFAETTPLLLLAQMLENSGHPESLFRPRTPSGRSLKQCYDALIRLLFPDRTLPTIGDCYGRRAHVAESPDWEILFRRYGEPAYAWLLADHAVRPAQALFSGEPSLAAPPPPAQFSKLWPEMGYAALRSNEGTNFWSGEGWSAFVTFSGQPVHEHADKLSLILYAGGHLWLPDCEARPSAEHAFSSATQAGLNRETLCHNTLLVDGRSQRFPGQRLDLIAFSNSPAFKQVSIGDLTGRLYEGVRQLRTVVVCADYVLDFFQAVSTRAHEYGWLTHVDGRAVAAPAHVTNVVKWPESPPWSFLRSPRSAHGASIVRESFGHDNQTLHLELLADGPMEIIHCGFPKDDTPAAGVIPMRWYSRHGTNAWFAALYRLGGSLPLAGGLDGVRPGEGTVEINVRTGGKTVRHRLPGL
jgi:hypothetical protein